MTPPAAPEHSPAQSPLRRKGREYVVLAVFLLAIMAAPELLRLRSFAGHIIEPVNRRPMAAFTVPQLDGGVWRLTDHRGQVVLVNFWATWCGPCREELPGLATLARNHPASDLAVLGISLDHTDEPTIRDFAAHYKLPYPIARVDPKWQLDQIPADIPTTVLIDREGRIAKTYSGAIRGKDFEADVAQLLREPSRT